MNTWLSDFLSIRFRLKDGEFSFHIGMLWILLLVLWLVAGCAGAPGRYHADQNRDYARNCGAAMDELGLCRP